jgi:hypothetical protein
VTPASRHDLDLMPHLARTDDAEAHTEKLSVISSQFSVWFRELITDN